MCTQTKSTAPAGKYSVFLSGGLLALATALTALPAAAQETDTSDLSEETEAERALETVIVTARGREETLQDIPESIIAFDADDIEARGLKYEKYETTRWHKN
ncbi:MAG: hypothetical protein F6K17_40605 [Okeania sp. SIO3C4]|nr:hypothetical protein [Okeania sp. SIO3C4]